MGNELVIGAAILGGAYLLSRTAQGTPAGDVIPPGVNVSIEAGISPVTNMVSDALQATQEPQSVPQEPDVGQGAGSNVIDAVLEALERGGNIIVDQPEEQESEAQSDPLTGGEWLDWFWDRFRDEVTPFVPSVTTDTVEDTVEDVVENVEETLTEVVPEIDADAPVRVVDPQELFDRAQETFTRTEEVFDRLQETFTRTEEVFDRLQETLGEEIDVPKIELPEVKIPYLSDGLENFQQAIQGLAEVTPGNFLRWNLDNALRVLSPFAGLFNRDNPFPANVANDFPSGFADSWLGPEEE